VALQISPRERVWIPCNKLWKVAEGRCCGLRRFQALHAPYPALCCVYVYFSARDYRKIFPNLIWLCLPLSPNFSLQFFAMLIKLLIVLRECHLDQREREPVFESLEQGQFLLRQFSGTPPNSSLYASPITEYRSTVLPPTFCFIVPNWQSVRPIVCELRVFVTTTTVMPVQDLFWS
jgi:hypothetical protein